MTRIFDEYGDRRLAVAANEEMVRLSADFVEAEGAEAYDIYLKIEYLEHQIENVL